MYLPSPEIMVVYLSSLQGVPHDWDESCAWIDQWCRDHKASFYSVPGEDFFLFRARELAIAEGNTTVLVDSLS